MKKKHDKTVWEVEILGADGKMTEVHIDAGTGTIIDKEAKQEKHRRRARKKSTKVPAAGSRLQMRSCRTVSTRAIHLPRSPACHSRAYGSDLRTGGLTL
ncbi:MAG: PepSY domain-containing protein [Nitrospira sp.]|nr:PepSY domain-containing protein [Nitrospira sp.]